MTALASSSQVLKEKYDVFINFRGLDIRHRFLSHLTKQLRHEGIDVYVDESMEKGREITSALLEAIERSIIALVIFSKNYASSEWCLQELVKIMKCKRLNNQIVIPIFYNVDPSHVRHQRNSYAIAFAKHEKRFKDDLLQIWRHALNESANLSGYHHSSHTHDDSDVINEIVKDVLNKLEDKDTIVPKRQLIGFEENLATIELFMKVDSEEVGVLGIWGKGGIGKTTLALTIFDKFRRQFDSSYFVSNVREESKRIGLTCLLEKLLSVLLNDENLAMKGEIPNIQRRLSRTRVLLVLDDVDQSNQLEFLLEENLSLGPGSKVIVTSRDKHVLVSGGEHVVVHEVKELKRKESLQLFCRHAFKQPYPEMGYEMLAGQAIEYAKGLPLALKVLGSYLKSKEKETWECTLKKLRKYPIVEIQRVLQVSYDGLESLEQRIFLDIAFFFNGGKKEDIIRVLDACDAYPRSGIDRLLDKALITISIDNRVEIHDSLQEMAKEIVREKSREHPEKRSRLNDVKEIQDVLKNNMGTSAIEGIALNSNELENDLYLRADTFQKMSNLRFLHIKRDQKKIRSHSRFSPVHLPYGLDSLPNKLNYFCWESYPLQSLPLGFSPKQLVKIYMPYSKVVKLWDGVQDLVNLKIVNLRHSVKLKELPNLTLAQNLEIVDLTDCQNLCSIHPSMLSLPKLISLDLSYCIKLKNLHVDKHMKSLKHLELGGCSALEEFSLSSEEMTTLSLFGTNIKTLELPFARFSKLVDLTINGASLMSLGINELSCLTSLRSFFLGYFRQRIEQSELAILFNAWCSLEQLHLVGCVIPEIPDNVSGLSLLKGLSLRQCNVESLPNSIKRLSELKLIDLGKCYWLRSLPKFPPSITHYYVENCTSLLKNLEREMTEFLHFTLMRAIFNNYYSEVRFCYPGTTFPLLDCITAESVPSSSDLLLGLVCYCVLPPLDLSSVQGLIRKKIYFEDEEIIGDYKREFRPFWKLYMDNVFVWYDPMELIFERIKRRYGEVNFNDFACEFFIEDSHHSHLVEYDELIKECGIRPIYASELKEALQQMKSKLKKGTLKTTQVTQHQPTLLQKRGKPK